MSELTQASRALLVRHALAGDPSDADLARVKTNLFTALGEAVPGQVALAVAPVRTPRAYLAAVSAKRRRLVLRAGAAAAVFVAFLVGWKAVDLQQERAQRQVEAAAARHAASSAAVFQEAKNFAREGDWRRARAVLEELRDTHPDFEPASVQAYLSRAEVEIRDQDLIAAAAAALKDDELEKAATALAHVKTEQVQQGEKVTHLRAELDARVDVRLAEVRRLVGEAPKDPEGLEHLAELCRVLLVIRPGARDAVACVAYAEQTIARATRPGIPPPRPPSEEVMHRFRDGDQAGARALAQTCASRFSECRTLVAQLETYDSMTTNLERLNHVDLVTLVELDVKLSGGQPSAQSKAMRMRMAAVFFLEATRAKAMGDWAKAVAAARRVLLADPEHVGARAIISEARDRAKDLYLRGYQLKETSPDEAAALFKQVLSVTPSDDEYHQKADARIAELRGR